MELVSWPALLNLPVFFTVSECKIMLSSWQSGGVKRPCI